jgi:hypothetical protein
MYNWRTIKVIINKSIPETSQLPKFSECGLSNPKYPKAGKYDTVRKKTNNLKLITTASGYVLFICGLTNTIPDELR